MGTQAASVCVIGGGIIGSWSALHLVEAGVNTTLIEQFPLPHARGSSHGATRAFRFLGDDRLERLEYSLQRWQVLEETLGDPLFLKTGLLNFGPSGDPYLEKHMAVLKNGNRPCEWLDSATIAQRYPMLRYPSEWGAAWDPNGGILFAHRGLNAVQSSFQALGGKIVNGRASLVESNSDGVRVGLSTNLTGESMSLDFDRAIICAGPWTAKLLPGLGDILRSLLIAVTYWQDLSGSCGVSNGFPILFNARLTGVYAFPSCEYHGLVKVLYHGGPESDPDTRDLASIEPYIEKVAGYVRKHLPTVDPTQPAILESCMYTMTPDNEPILDRIDRNIVVGCGFSGSGFKHSPATGQMLAHLALGQEASLPGGYHSEGYLLSRFQNQDPGY